MSQQQQAIPDNVWICETKDEVLKIVDDNRIVIVKLGAEWCGPCREAHIPYRHLAAQYMGMRGIAFLDVDIDKNDMYNEEITAVPVFLFYVDKERDDSLMLMGGGKAGVRDVGQKLNEILQELSKKSAPEEKHQAPRSALGASGEIEGCRTRGNPGPRVRRTHTKGTFDRDSRPGRTLLDGV